MPLGAWCGSEDPFSDAARELVDRARPRVRAVERGAHDRGCLLRVRPDALRFVGERVTR